MPTYIPKQKTVFKLCEYSGCEKEFFGRHNQKYCSFHTNPHHRKRLRVVPDGPEIKNQIILHHFSDVTKIKCHCALEGCDEDFYINLYPRQTVYPKYCEKHRTEFQRMNFKRMNRPRIAV